MPITRSQAGDRRRQSTDKERFPEAMDASGTSGTSGISGTTVASTATTSTIGTSGTTGTMLEATTVATSVPRDSTTNTTNKAQAGKSTRPNSVSPSQTKDKARKRRETELRVEISRRALQEAQAAASLARAEMELLRLDEEEDEVEADSADEEPEDRAEEVQNWVEHTVSRMSGGGHQGEGGTSAEGRPGGALKSPMKLQDPAAAVVKPEDTAQGEKVRGVGALARAIVSAVSAAPKTGYAHQPAYMHELPVFDGSLGEWLAFKTVFEDTASLFSAVQNMARLRKAIKGTARETVRSILYSECSPEEVLESLRRRFGRPDALVLAELEKVKNLPRTTENARDVCAFASTINNTVATIKGLKKPQYLNSPEMLKVIIEKLPTVLKYRWYDFAAEHEDPDLSLMALFLNREAERCGPYAAQETTVQRKVGTQRQSTHAASEAQDTQKACPHCEGSHELEECRKFLQIAVTDRWAVVRKSGYCFKCLRSRHRKETCKRPPCKHCRRWHHHLLHEERPPQVTKDQESSATKEVTNNVHLTRDQVNATKDARAYLKMVPVEVYGPQGKVQILALLDEGSTVTLLDSAVANEIGLNGPEQALSLETVGGRVITKEDSMRVDVSLKGLHSNQRKMIRGARTIDKLKLSPQAIDRARLEECTHLKKLADKLHYDREAPKLLIGQDNWELIVSRVHRKGKRGQPAASLTHLGWVLHGMDGGAARRVNRLTCAHVSTRDDLDELMKRHFEIESLGVQPRRPSTDADERALLLMKRTTRRIDDGRFETGMLWKTEEETMPDNYESAWSRLRNIERKLDKDPDLKTEYKRQIDNLLTSKYAEEVRHESASLRKWYLPHFAVTHPTKKKKRLVFDAAAKHQGKSLNDALLSGPDLLQSLFGVLLRFREKPVAVVSDIQEMFLQVKIREEDRDSLRFLWRGDRRTGTPKEYRMTSVIFGAACSPSLAIYVKNLNAEEVQSQYPEAVEAVVRNHYMDDYLHCFSTEEEALRVARQVDSIHQRAGFRLRGWASNKERVLKGLTDKVNAEVELGSKEEKTLGLRWFTTEDEIGFRTSLRNVSDVVSQGRTPTKRQVTSAVMSTFDPLGLASPVLIQGKKLLQDIWRSGVGWDDKVTETDETAWRAYLRDLHILDDMRVPRCISHRRAEGEIHVFTDASESAYACAVYWRQQNQGGYTVTLLAGKARVTPLKPVSIPRLELQAALLGARLAHSVEEEMNVKATRKIYWTDSSTVLSWIRADPRTFKPFVAHRLAEIEDTTRPQQWRWVPTAQNPADDATREIPRDFGKNHRWYKGPEFLEGEEEGWPEDRTFKKKSTGEEKEEQTVAATRVHEYEAVTPDPERFSKWTRLLRAMARVLQFIDLCRKKDTVSAVKDGDPTWRKTTRGRGRVSALPTVMKKRAPVTLVPVEGNHLERAERVLLQRSQEESRFEENKKLRKLDTTNEDGLIRLRGRIDAAEVTLDEKRPVVLDSKEKVTKLLIAHYHERFHHGNHATVVNEIRQRYWILGLRSAVRSICYKCQWCRVYRGAPQRLPKGDLPKERLRSGEAPFTYTAVDYFGPMTVTVGRRHEKRWGALFTCLTTRAVHLELAASLSADSMILALRRMAARRGQPKTIFSDNGTNFVGANRELKDALQQLDKGECTARAEEAGIRWKFIAPGAPNMGGAWERLVKSVKVALAVTLKERHPREEVLHTLLLEAEHIVNSRPLTTTEDSDEGGLTPNHFLIGKSCGAPRLGAFTEEDNNERRSWRTAQRLADHFWARWVREYLPTLVPRRSNGPTSERDLQCGDTVLIVDSTLPRNMWPRGVVARTYPGPDNRTRVIDVRTSHGVLKRPCSKAVLLVPKDNTQV